MIVLCLICRPVSLQGQTVDRWYQDGKVFLKLSKKHYNLNTIPTLEEGRSEDEGIPVSKAEFLADLRGQYDFEHLSRPFKVAEESDTLQMTYELAFRDSTKIDALIEDLTSKTEVAYAEKVPYHEPSFTPNDPQYSNQYHINNIINAREAWDITQGSSNINVAITDNAIDIDHQDLAGIVANSRDVADGDNDPRPSGNKLHGTHTSGIACAITNNNTGVASIGAGVSLMAVKISSDNSSSITDGYAGINWAANNGADVINMSWGGAGGQNCSTCQSVISNAVNQGVVLAASAGNSGTNNQVYPAAYSDVMAVGASNSNDQQASLSQYGSWVDVVAPGIQILSSTPNDNYSYQSGTSMSSPVVAGLAGLLLSLDPNMSVSKVRNCIETTGVDIGFQGGALRIDAEEALLCANPSSPPTADFSATNTNACPGATIQFNDQSTGNVNSYSWSFPNGSPNSSTAPNPAVTYNSVGTYDVSVTVTNSNGSDTESKTGYITISNAGTQVVFEEDFESGSFSTNNWNVVNPDNGITWEIQSVSGNSPGDKAARVNHYNYNNASGERDALISKTLDFSGNSDLEMSFEHAHRRYSQNYADSLIIYVSTDGGSTYPDRIFAKAEDGSGSFATNTTTNSDFVPSNSDDWCFGGSAGASCFTLDLSNYDGQSNVKLKFETVNDYGNNTYIDNIEITGTCSGSSQGPTADFTANKTTVTAGNSVDFTDQSSGSNITSWDWTFNGAATSSSMQQNPSGITYSNTGTYDVSLTVTDNNGSDIETKTNYIEVVPPSGSSCDSILHIDAQDSLALYGYQGGGYLAGHNADGIDAFADSFTVNQSGMEVTGVYMGFAVAKASSANDSITVHVWDAANGSPGSSLGTKKVQINRISIDVTNQQLTYVDFSNNPVSISGDFFVGFSITYGQGDTVAMITNQIGQSTPATAWSRFQGSWLNYDEFQTPLELSHLIQPVFCPSSGGSNCGNLSVSLANKSDVSCNGGNDGSITVSPGGGTTPYSYTWSNLANTANNTGLSAGTYSVTVIDDNQCTVSNSFTVTEPQAMNISVSSTDADCGQSNGSATANVSNGASPYTYNWSSGDSGSTANNLAGGSYSLTVTDDNGCQETTNVKVNSVGGPALSVTNTTDASCNNTADGSASVSATGGTQPYTYVWSNGDTSSSISNVTGGSYTVTVYDDNQCSDTKTINISEPAPINVAVSSSPASCNQSDGSASVNASNGSQPYDYNWSNGNQTSSISGVSAGSYSVTVTDDNNCSTVQNATITNPDAPNISANVTDVDCDGNANGSIDLTVSGGSTPYDYSWSNGNQTEDLTNVGSGTYTVTVTDDSNCIATKLETIDEPSAINVTANAINDATCGNQNGSATASASGGTGAFSYTWSNNMSGPTINNISGGTYQVTVTDGNGCTATSAAIVESTPDVDLSYSNISDDPCGQAEGAVTVVPNGGQAPYSYSWSNGANAAVLKDLTAGNYVVTLTDNNNCTEIDTVQIQGSDSLTVSSGTKPDTSGQGQGTAFVDVQGGTAPYSYNWSNGMAGDTITGLSTGAYEVTITDANNCSKTETVQVGVVGIAEQEEKTSVAVYPNPTTGQFKVVLNGERTRDYSVNIYNTIGERVYSRTNVMLNQQESLKIDLSDQAAGIYILKLADEEAAVTKRIIVQGH